MLIRGTPYLFRRLFWFPAWFLGCEDAAEGGLRSGEQGLAAQRTSDFFMAFREPWAAAISMISRPPGRRWCCLRPLAAIVLPGQR